MEGIAGTFVQSALPCQHRTCSSQTMGRAPQRVQKSNPRSDRRFAGNCTPFSSVSSGKGAGQPKLPVICWISQCIEKLLLTIS